jgi:hypothetical protein
MIVRTRIELPRADGTIATYEVGEPAAFERPAAPIRSRVAYAAVHVVANPLADHEPWHETQLDWEATLAYRHHLWGHGLAVAEAMDTAQRGMGLDWPTAKLLIRRSLAEARAAGTLDRIAAGAGTDHLAPRPGLTLSDITAAYDEQCAFVEGEGGRVILMASRALAAVATGPDDYATVYDYILSRVSRPVIIHWLGEMFDPALAGYWGSSDLEPAMETCLQVIQDHAAKVDGIKLSLLDPDCELVMRRRLPAGVRLYTGDDFNYPAMIRGDGTRHSDALLGIFDAIAPAAGAALAALDAGDLARYEAILEPTVPLARHIFRAPTQYYKTGVVFLAYLNGHQRHFHLVGGLQSARSIVHLAELFALADRAGLLVDPEQAAERMRRVLAVAGVA